MKYLMIAVLIATAAHAETLEQAVHKATVKYHLKEEKKIKREKIKAKYKPKLDAIKEQMKNEIAGDCTTDNECGGAY